MRPRHLPKSPASLCALALLCSVLLIRPFAEMGLVDDFSYVRTAKYLADTGHLDYFGWATPILGWQLLLGAGFIKLFGFSFSIVRASVFCLALATTFLLHATFVRAGLRQRNATFAVLTIIFSPIFLPLSFTYMSDIAGLLAIVLCLYGCLRSVQAADTPTALRWLAFAALSNTVGGTARQIAWLGVLVMVPSTLWLLRHRRPPWIAALGLWCVCVGLVFGTMLWFSHQLFSQPERIFVGRIDLAAVHTLFGSFLHFLLGLSLLLLPIFTAFFAAPAVRTSWRLRLILGATLAIGLLIFVGLRTHVESTVVWLAPFNGDVLTATGMLAMPELGSRPVVLTTGVRIILTMASLAATSSFLLFFWRMPARQDDPSRTPPPVSWYQLMVLVGPFCLAYLGMLMPRGAFESMRDRYGLAVLVIASILLLRLFQERVQQQLPLASFVCLGLFASFSIAATHDLFAMHRARVSAAQQLIASGIPPTSFYGGFEYDGNTQIDQWGYINANAINVPPGVPYHYGTLAAKPCGYSAAKLFIAVHPMYALSFSPTSCLGPSRFAPVPYRTWLPPFSGTIYTQRVSTLSKEIAVSAQVANRRGGR